MNRSSHNQEAKMTRRQSLYLAAIKRQGGTVTRTVFPDGVGEGGPMFVFWAKDGDKFRSKVEAA